LMATMMWTQGIQVAMSTTHRMTMTSLEKGAVCVCVCVRACVCMLRFLGTSVHCNDIRHTIVHCNDIRHIIGYECALQ
jgi:hypothetical protein